MKRMISCVLLFVMILTMLPTVGFASDVHETVVASYEDGSYMTEEISEQGIRASGSKTGTKTRNYYNSNNDLAWKVVLTGKFTYTGSSATCTSSSINATIYNSAWYVVSKSSSKTSNKAKGTAVMGEKALGVTVGKVQVDLTLTCDANGNLS